MFSNGQSNMAKEIKVGKDVVLSTVYYFIVLKKNCILFYYYIIYDYVWKRLGDLFDVYSFLDTYYWGIE